MFELIAMSLLGAAYVSALAKEASDEAKEKEKERIQDLKIKVFRYAVLNRVSYNFVVEKIRNKELTIEQIDNYLERVSNE